MAFGSDYISLCLGEKKKWKRKQEKEKEKGSKIVHMSIKLKKSLRKLFPS